MAGLEWKEEYSEEELYIMYGDQVPECFKKTGQD